MQFNVIKSQIEIKMDLFFTLVVHVLGDISDSMVEFLTHFAHSFFLHAQAFFVLYSFVTLYCILYFIRSDTLLCLHLLKKKRKENINKKNLKVFKKYVMIGVKRHI